MDTAKVLDALEVVRRSSGDRRPPFGLITHGDADSPPRFTSVRFTDRRDEIGARPSSGTVAESFDKALVETANGRYKAECVAARQTGRRELEI